MAIKFNGFEVVDIPKSGLYLGVKVYKGDKDSSGALVKDDKAIILTDIDEAQKIGRMQLSDGTKLTYILSERERERERIILSPNEYGTRQMSELYPDAYRTMIEIPNRDDKAWDISKLTNTNYMFQHCEKLTTLDVSSFDTINITSMRDMFTECGALTSLDLSHFNTSKVTDMGNMFENCFAIKVLDLLSFDTSNVTNMDMMFVSCESLTDLDISNFDTSKVSTMEGMFMDCSNLTTIKGIIDMKSCTRYDSMFENCPKLTGVKIKNPPADFEAKTGLTSSQYTIVQ